MSSIRDADLFNAWLAAERLPVTYVRALIEELDWQRQLPRQSWAAESRWPQETPSNEIEHPLLLLRNR